MAARNTLVALLVVAVLGSIAAKKPRRAYLQTYEAHTEQLVVYFGFATALNMRATLLTKGMRDAIEAERTRLMNPSEENAASFASRMDRDLSQYHEVVFSADAGVEGRLAFGDTDAQWNLRLEADGIDQPLVAVEKIRRPTPVHRGLYPHINHWSDLWIARFERTKEAPGVVRLLVGSGYGNGEITYTLRP